MSHAHRRTAATAAVLLLCLTAVLSAAPAEARVAVDPDTLSPVPPAGATCWQTGDDAVCHTFVFIESEAEPLTDLPCGTIYVNGPDHRLGTRWYDHGVLARRLVRQDTDQTLSLQPDGSGPALTVSQHDSWWGVSDDALVFHGNEVLVRTPDGGVVAHIAGLDELDGTHHGVLTWIEDPDVVPVVCAALT